MRPNRNIALNPFVKRQTPGSRFSHFDGPWKNLLELVIEHVFEADPGYREGVIRVPLPPQGFWSSAVVLEEGARLIGHYERRSPTEEPRKSISVIGQKQPAVAVEAILYHHTVLLEGDEQSCDADWEVIAIIARMTKEPSPMDPETLMANHFQISGGTATHMSDADFVAALKESFLYWRNKALCEPED